MFYLFLSNLAYEIQSFNMSKNVVYEPSLKPYNNNFVIFSNFSDLIFSVTMNGVSYSLSNGFVTDQNFSLIHSMDRQLLGYIWSIPYSICSGPSFYFSTFNNGLISLDTDKTGDQSKNDHTCFFPTNYEQFYNYEIDGDKSIETEIYCNSSNDAIKCTQCKGQLQKNSFFFSIPQFKKNKNYHLYLKNNTGDFHCYCKPFLHLIEYQWKEFAFKNIDFVNSCSFDKEEYILQYVLGAIGIIIVVGAIWYFIHKICHRASAKDSETFYVIA